MDAMHEKGVKAFPAKTEGKGNQLLAPRMEGGVKVFELTAEKIEWEIGARSQGGSLGLQRAGPRSADPRPRRRPRPGRSSRTSCPSPPPSTSTASSCPTTRTACRSSPSRRSSRARRYTYEFTVPNAGSHMYHSHHNAAKQVGLGLLGAFIVEPKDRGRSSKADVDYVMILNDGVARLHAQRQELPGHRADRGQARPEGPHPLHERRDDDPPDAPARDAHDGDRQGRLGRSRRRGSATRSTSRPASAGT